MSSFKITNGVLTGYGGDYADEDEVEVIIPNSVTEIGSGHRSIPRPFFLSRALTIRPYLLK